MQIGECRPYPNQAIREAVRTATIETCGPHNNQVAADPLFGFMKPSKKALVDTTKGYGMWCRRQLEHGGDTSSNGDTTVVKGTNGNEHKFGGECVLRTRINDLFSDPLNTICSNAISAFPDRGQFAPDAGLLQPFPTKLVRVSSATPNTALPTQGPAGKEVQMERKYQAYGHPVTSYDPYSQQYYGARRASGLDHCEKLGLFGETSAKGRKRNYLWYKSALHPCRSKSVLSVAYLQCAQVQWRNDGSSSTRNQFGYTAPYQPLVMDPNTAVSANNGYEYPGIQKLCVSMPVHALVWNDRTRGGGMAKTVRGYYENLYKQYPAAQHWFNPQEQRRRGNKFWPAQYNKNDELVLYEWPWPSMKYSFDPTTTGGKGLKLATCDNRCVDGEFSCETEDSFAGLLNTYTKGYNGDVTKGFAQDDCRAFTDQTACNPNFKFCKWFDADQDFDVSGSITTLPAGCNNKKLIVKLNEQVRQARGAADVAADFHGYAMCQQHTSAATCEAASPPAGTGTFWDGLFHTSFCGWDEVCTGASKACIATAKSAQPFEDEDGNMIDYDLLYGQGPAKKAADRYINSVCCTTIEGTCNSRAYRLACFKMKNNKVFGRDSDAGGDPLSPGCCRDNSDSPYCLPRVKDYAPNGAIHTKRLPFKSPIVCEDGIADTKGASYITDNRHPEFFSEAVNKQIIAHRDEKCSADYLVDKAAFQNARDNNLLAYSGFEFNNEDNFKSLTAAQKDQIFADYVVSDTPPDMNSDPTLQPECISKCPAGDVGIFTRSSIDRVYCRGMWIYQPSAPSYFDESERLLKDGGTKIDRAGSSWTTKRNGGALDFRYAVSNTVCTALGGIMTTGVIANKESVKYQILAKRAGRCLVPEERDAFRAQAAQKSGAAMVATDWWKKQQEFNYKLWNAKTYKRNKWTRIKCVDADGDLKDDTFTLKGQALLDAADVSAVGDIAGGKEASYFEAAAVCETENVGGTLVLKKAAGILCTESAAAEDAVTLTRPGDDATETVKLADGPWLTHDFHPKYKKTNAEFNAKSLACRKSGSAMIMMKLVFFDEVMTDTHVAKCAVDPTLCAAGEPVRLEMDQTDVWGQPLMWQKQCKDIDNEVDCIAKTGWAQETLCAWSNDACKAGAYNANQYGYNAWLTKAPKNKGKGGFSYNLPVQKYVGTNTVPAFEMNAATALDA